jgi:hypothetical protein
VISLKETKAREADEFPANESNNLDGVCPMN